MSRSERIAIDLRRDDRVLTAECTRDDGYLCVEVTLADGIDTSILQPLPEGFKIRSGPSSADARLVDTEQASTGAIRT